MVSNLFTYRLQGQQATQPKGTTFPEQAALVPVQLYLERVTVDTAVRYGETIYGS